ALRDGSRSFAAGAVSPAWPAPGSPVFVRSVERPALPGYPVLRVTLALHAHPVLMTPVLSLLHPLLLQTVHLAINRGGDLGFLILDPVIMHVMEQIVKAVLALDRRERHAFTAPRDLRHPLLVLKQDPIQAGMQLLDLHLGEALPLPHGVFQTLANPLILHVKK